MSKVVELQLPEEVYTSAENAAARQGQSLQTWLQAFVAKQVRYEELVLKLANREALMSPGQVRRPGAIKAFLDAAKSDQSPKPQSHEAIPAAAHNHNEQIDADLAREYLNTHEGE